MTIAFGTEFIPNGNTTAAANIALTTGVGCSVGELVLVYIFKDNTSTTSGDNGEVTSVQDFAASTTNVYTKAMEHTTAGAAGSTATVSVWYCILTTALSSADNIQANFASCTSKLISGSRWTIAANAKLSVTATARRDDSAADPGSMTIAPPLSLPALFFRAIASESNAVTSPTATTNYTGNHVGEANTGTSLTSIVGNYEYRLTQSVSETSDPTLFSADHASVFFSIAETPKGIPFPQSPYLPFLTR